VPANVELVRSIYAAWERGDYSSAQWAHPEIEYVMADSPDAGTRRGLAGMAEGWRGFLSLWTDFHTEADEFIELAGARVVVLTSFGGLEVEHARAKGAAVFEIRAGKVTKLNLYLEQQRALADLGLDPKTGSPGV
jgi:ketosteroid isomerase-like protein